MGVTPLWPKIHGAVVVEAVVRVRVHGCPGESAVRGARMVACLGLWLVGSGGKAGPGKVGVVTKITCASGGALVPQMQTPTCGVGGAVDVGLLPSALKGGRTWR